MKMDLAGRIVIKSQLGDDIRKIPIHNDEVTYDELVIMMQRVYKGKISQEDELVLKYTDEDGDLVTLFDTSDVAFAIQTCNRYLKLVIFVNSSGLSSDDPAVSYIKGRLDSIRDEVNKIYSKLNDDKSGNDSSNKLDKQTTQSTGDSLVVKAEQMAVNSEYNTEFDPLNPAQAQATPTAPLPSSLPDVSASAQPQQSAPELDQMSQYSGSEMGDQQNQPYQQINTNQQQTVQDSFASSYNQGSYTQPRYSQTNSTTTSQYPNQYSQAPQPNQHQNTSFQTAVSWSQQYTTPTAGTGGLQQGYQQPQAQTVTSTAPQPGYGNTQQQPQANMYGQGYGYQQTAKTAQQTPGQTASAAGQPTNPMPQPQYGYGPQAAGTGSPRMPPAGMAGGAAGNPYSKPGQLGGAYPRAMGAYPPLPAQQYAQQPTNQPPVMNTQ